MAKSRKIPMTEAVAWTLGGHLIEESGHVYTDLDASDDGPGPERLLEGSLGEKLEAFSKLAPLPVSIALTVDECALICNEVGRIMDTYYEYEDPECEEDHYFPRTTHRSFYALIRRCGNAYDAMVEPTLRRRA